MKKKAPQNRRRTGAGCGGIIPPAKHRFKPGQSGNPGGRPKSKLVTQAYQELLEKVDSESGKTVAQIIAEKVVIEAQDNNLAAVKEITDRTEGKAAQQVQLSGDINATVYVMERLKELEDAERRVENDNG